MVDWRGRRQSTNIEDRRSGAGRLIAGGATLVTAAGGCLTSGLVLCAGLCMGGSPGEILRAVQEVGEPAASSSSDIDDERAFLAVILADTEDTWTELFAEAGSRYRAPKLVLYSDSVQSACGFETAATGPFYCPMDQKIYLDTSFFDALEDQFDAPGDFAAAYVVAHEVGHHIQRLTSVMSQVAKKKKRLGKRERNALSVRVELQADCYAGVWAHHAEAHRDLLEDGDIEEGLSAAAAVGDDRLQKKARGRATPESFTHGSSAQRVRWFRRGLKSGKTADCNPFGVAEP